VEFEIKIFVYLGNYCQSAENGLQFFLRKKADGPQPVVHVPASKPGKILLIKKMCSYSSLIRVQESILHLIRKEFEASHVRSSSGQALPHDQQ